MLGFDVIIYFLIAIVALFIIVKIFAWPMKIFLKLVINAALGALLLWLINLFGSFLSIQIPINAVTSLIAGFLGVPGVIFLIIFNMIA